MTTADYLHATATLMRERAQAATPGPWEQDTYTWQGEHGRVSNWELVHPQEFGGHVVHPANVVKARGAEHAADSCCWPPSDADATHLAAMHPAVALAVADWLDQWADHMALHAEDVADGLRPEVCPRCDAGNEYDHVCNDAALAVCRAYNPEGEGR